MSSNCAKFSSEPGSPSGPLVGISLSPVQLMRRINNNVGISLIEKKKLMS